MFSRLWFFQYIERCFEVETGVSRFSFIIKDIFGQSKPTEKYGKCMWQLNLFRKTTVPALCLSFLLHQEYLSYQWKYPAGEVGPSSAFVVIFGGFFPGFLVHLCKVCLDHQWQRDFNTSVRLLFPTGKCSSVLSSQCFQKAVKNPWKPSSQ